MYCIHSPKHNNIITPNCMNKLLVAKGKQRNNPVATRLQQLALQIPHKLALYSNSLDPKCNHSNLTMWAMSKCHYLKSDWTYKTYHDSNKSQLEGQIANQMCDHFAVSYKMCLRHIYKCFNRITWKQIWTSAL